MKSTINSKEKPSKEKAAIESVKFLYLVGGFGVKKIPVLDSVAASKI